MASIVLRCSKKKDTLKSVSFFLVTVSDFNARRKSIPPTIRWIRFSPLAKTLVRLISVAPPCDTPCFTASILFPGVNLLVVIHHPIGAFFHFTVKVKQSYTGTEQSHPIGVSVLYHEVSLNSCNTRYPLPSLVYLFGIRISATKPIFPHFIETVHFINLKILQIWFKFQLPPINRMPHFQRFRLP